MSEPYSPYPQPLRAPEGTNPSTVHFWLLIAVYGAQCIPAFIYLLGLDVTDFFVSSMNPDDPFSIFSLVFTPAYLAVIITSLLAYAAMALFAYLDMKELKDRGMPSPFHWATSLIPSYGSLVYVIGRVVVVYRRTRGGLTELWVFIAVTVVSVIVSIIGTFVMMNSMMSQFSVLAP